MSEFSRGGWRACMVGLAAASVLLGALMHPYVANETNAADVAAGLASSTRWLWSHVLLLVGLALTAAAGPLLARHFEATRGAAWSVAAVPLLAIGAGLSAVLVGGEGIGGYWGYLADFDLPMVMEAAEASVPIFVLGFVMLGLGMVCTAVAAWRSGFLLGGQRAIAAAGLVIAAVASMTPAGAAIYVFGLAFAAGLAPLVNSMWHQAMSDDPTTANSVLPIVPSV